jgi:hypothetical protein
MDDRWRQDDRNRWRDTAERERIVRERAERDRAERARDPRREAGAFGEIYSGAGRYDGGWGRPSGPQDAYGRDEAGRQDWNRPDRGREAWGRDDYVHGREAGPSAWRGEDRPRGRGPDAHPEEDRSWFDRARDEVGSWMGDDEAERRRRGDARDEGRERSLHGRGRDDDTVWADPVRGDRLHENPGRGGPVDRYGDRPGLWAQDDLRLAEERRAREDRQRREEAERWRHDRRGSNRDW